MKLALIRRQFSATGGAELYLQRLLAALAERGHQLHLLAEGWDNVPHGVTLHPLGVAATRAQRPVAFADAVQGELARQTFDCVFSFERTRRQDVYRAGDGVHRVWLRRRRRHAPWWRRSLVGLGAFHRNVLRLEAETFDPRNTRHVIVNSEMVRKEILEHFTFPAERIHLVRNGVDVARFQSGEREATRESFGVKSDEFLLLFVGSGWERKGLKYALQALRLLQLGAHLGRISDSVRQLTEAARTRLAEAAKTVGTPLPGIATPAQPESRPSLPLSPDKVKLLVVGKGKRPVQHPANVLFAGPLSAPENAYAAADLFVFLPIYEPSANVVCEALAAGLPVVTTAQNGAAELIEDGVNGTVIDDSAAIKEVVEAIVFWWSRRFYLPPVNAAELSIERNVSETLAVLEQAAIERKG
jgi:UDP-glucose:(heptosyl)LPS alpha-1,3-glucosyltransferase